MNNDEKNKFLGILYDILVTNNIKSYDEKPKDIKEKINRLNDYLDKLKRVQDRAIDNERYLDMIKNLYYDRYIIKEENIPDGYLKFLENQYLEQGYGHINLVEPKTYKDQELKKEHIKTIIKEQRDSLDNWLNYFLSKDSDYLPMWAKVWAFQGMLQIGNLNKDKDGYDKRSKTTTNPFVSFDSEILGRCVTLIEETFEKKEMTDEEVKKLVESGSFSKLYGKLLANKKQVKTETTDGIWIKYNQESENYIEIRNEQGKELEYIKLYNSLQGYNTGWCTAGSRETAKDQIKGGDFYVYYSKDKDGEYKIPRLAIRMIGNQIGEIRGIAENQNIESNMELILEEKLKEFPDASRYKKKVSDMKLLTNIYNKYLNKEELTKDDLKFLYEIDELILGFGYDKDPRIKEILQSRNKLEDLMYIFECSKEQIILDGAIDKLQNSNAPIKYFEGNLFLDNLTNAEGLVLPEIINGDLYLTSLTNAEGLVLPKTINGDLYLTGLISAEGLALPETINGSLALTSLTNAEGLVLPKTINGDLKLDRLITSKDLDLSNTTITGALSLNRLINAEGLKFPKTINGDLWLDGLKIAKDLELPETINGCLYLISLTNAEGLVLPKTIKGSLDLNSLISAEGLVLPETINGDLYLENLTSAEGLVLPKTINGDLNLTSLTSVEGLVLPKTINGDLYLTSLTNAEGLVLPKIINGYLSLISLTNAEGLVLPKTIKGSLDLNSLISAEGLVLPETINGDLYLNSLTSLIGLTLPNIVKRKVFISGKSYTLDEVKEMQQKELISEKKVGLKRVKEPSSGIVSISFLIVSILLFCGLTFFICNSILNK